MRWERRRVNPPAFFALTISIQTVFKSISYFISHCKISIIHRIIADWLQFLRIDLAIRQDAFVRIDVDDSPTRMPSSKLFTLHSSAMGSSSISGALTKSLLAAHGNRTLRIYQVLSSQIPRPHSRRLPRYLRFRYLR